jgi:ABC-type multidrug transport system ATPase subunit
MYRLTHLNLEEFGLDSSALSKRISELSFGQRRRLALAICFGRRPTLAVLDEPLAGMDASGQSVVIERISLELEAGMTVVVTTHAPERFSHIPHSLIHLDQPAREG